MEIPKDEILQMLCDRGDDSKAQLAKQQLPDHVDLDHHADMLRHIGVDPYELLQASPVVQGRRAGGSGRPPTSPLGSSGSRSGGPRLSTT